MKKQAANTVGERFVRAVTSRDFPGIAACLTSDMQFRALVPRGLREAIGPEDATRYFQTWFGSADRVEVLTTKNDTIGDRRHLMWQLLVGGSGQMRIVEQHAFATLDGDRISQLDLVCSGFRPIQTDVPRPLEIAGVLDGDDQGCATLTPLIRAKLAELASQQVLEIRTREPSAAADIASWCTLTGNALLERRADDDLQRIYVRKK